MKLESGDAQTGTIRTHYLRTGGDKPPIILAHGFSDSGACWASLIRVLSPDYDVIAYDARGHGKSDTPEKGYSGQDRAADLLALVEVLGLDRPILMGHSMGGETVAWAAAMRPALARALILEDSGTPLSATGGDTQEVRSNMRKVLASWIADLKQRSLEELVAHVERNDPRWPVEDRLPWAESKHAISHEAIDGFALAEGSDLVDRYAAIPCPVLLLKADAKEEERRRHREIVSRFPKGEIVHVGGAGHNVRRDEHAKTAYHLGRFLGRVSSSGG